MLHYAAQIQLGIKQSEGRPSGHDAVCSHSDSPPVGSLNIAEARDILAIIVLHSDKVKRRVMQAIKLIILMGSYFKASFQEVVET